jgi:long-chain acyl-CoA synthetase
MKIARLFEFIDHQAAAYPKQDALAGKVNGSWVKYSTDDIIQASRRFAHGLLSSGLGPGDKIAMISANRPEWNIADLGMQQVGVINVPIYTTLSESDIVFILNDCGAKLVLAGDKALWDKVMSVKDRTPSGIT